MRLRPLFCWNPTRAGRARTRWPLWQSYDCFDLRCCTAFCFEMLFDTAPAFAGCSKPSSIQPHAGRLCQLPAFSPVGRMHLASHEATVLRVWLSADARPLKRTRMEAWQHLMV
jgi:hypothetical protein